MKVVFLGATKGMGRALARLVAERGDEVFLLGRDGADLERSARDLEARGAKGRVGTSACDLERPEGFAGALAAAEEALGGLETVIVTAGILAPQETLERDPGSAAKLLTVDFTNTVLFCEEARRRLLASADREPGAGSIRASSSEASAGTPPRPRTLCVFGSVAGDRARKPTLIYGAAKAGLAAYLEGLDHKFREAGLRTICVKPGFVKTSMTAGLPVPPFAGEPDDVARRVLGAIDRGEPVVYAPPIWCWVMLVVRWLPRFVMRRIEF